MLRCHGRIRVASNNCAAKGGAEQRGEGGVVGGSSERLQVQVQMQDEEHFPAHADERV